MTETSTATNNKSVTFRGKTEREMSVNHKDADGKPNEDASFLASAKNAKEADRAPPTKKPASRCARRPSAPWAAA